MIVKEYWANKMNNILFNHFIKKARFDKTIEDIYVLEMKCREDMEIIGKWYKVVPPMIRESRRYNDSYLTIKQYVLSDS